MSTREKARWSNTQLRIIEQAKGGSKLTRQGKLFRLVDSRGNGGTDHTYSTVTPLIEAGLVELSP